MFFPVIIDLEGVPCKPYRDWVCNGVVDTLEPCQFEIFFDMHMLITVFLPLCAFFFRGEDPCFSNTAKSITFHDY